MRTLASACRYPAELSLVRLPLTMMMFVIITFALPQPALKRLHSRLKLPHQADLTYFGKVIMTVSPVSMSRR